jgi:hypothetical protein
LYTLLAKTPPWGPPGKAAIFTPEHQPAAEAVFEAVAVVLDDAVLLQAANDSVAAKPSARPALIRSDFIKFLP